MFFRMRPFYCLTFICLSFAAAAQGVDPAITERPPSAAQLPGVDAPPGPAPRPTPPAARPSPAPSAESSSPLPDKDPASRVERLDALFADLKRASTSATADRTVDKIQAEWAASGSATADLMLIWAGEAVTDKRNGAAFDFLDQAILMKPDFAEAWNRRATLNYIASDYGKSLADIERTLQLEPRHFGALMGLGAILEATDRKAQALEAYVRVLEIYPTLKGAQDAVGRLSEELAGQRI